MKVGDNIRRLRELHDLTQRDLGTVIGVSDKAVSTWENGYKEPRPTTLKKLAAYFGVSLDELMGNRENVGNGKPDPVLATTFAHLCGGHGVSPEQIAYDLGIPMSRVQELAAGFCPTDDEANRLSEYFASPRSVLRDGTSVLTADLRNVIPLPATRSRRIAVLGRVPAGIPIEAVTDVVEEIELTGHAVDDGYDYFGLLVTGESMLPEYRDGDTVIVRRQAVAETGDDVVAYVGDSDATLKRLTITGNGLQLRPLNPAYNTLSFTQAEVAALPITIAGVVVEQRRVRRR